MVAAYDMPILCLVAVITLRRRFPGRTTLIFTAILTAGAVLTHAKHIASKLATVPTLKENLAFLIRDLGGLLNLDPLTHSNPFLPAIFSLTLWLIAALITGLRLQNKTLPAAFIFIAILSATATLSTILFINVPATSISARFILNVFYLFAVLLATLLDLAWQNFSRVEKLSLASMLALFTLSGLASTAPAWSRPGLAQPNPATAQLVAFLSQNALSYGYGPYWGAQANAVTAITGGKITIRPVIFSPATGEITRQIRAQSSPAWLSPADFPKAQTNFFVLIAADGEQCANPALCLRGVAAQLGAPMRVLHYGVATIMVFDRSKKELLF
jgi:hypothetical protein